MLWRTRHRINTPYYTALRNGNYFGADYSADYTDFGKVMTYVFDKQGLNDLKLPSSEYDPRSACTTSQK